MTNKSNCNLSNSDAKKSLCFLISLLTIQAGFEQIVDQVPYQTPPSFNLVNIIMKFNMLHHFGQSKSQITNLYQVIDSLDTF